MFKQIAKLALVTLIAAPSFAAHASSKVAELSMDLDKDGKADLIQIVDRNERYLRLELTTTKHHLRLVQENLIRSNHEKFLNGDEKNFGEIMEPELKEAGDGRFTLKIASFNNLRVSKVKSWTLELIGKSLMVRDFYTFSGAATGDEAWSEERDYDFEGLISEERLDNWDGEGSFRGRGAPIDPSCQPRLSAFVFGKYPKCVGSIWD